MDIFKIPEGLNPECAEELVSLNSLFVTAEWSFRCSGQLAAIWERKGCNLTPWGRSKGIFKGVFNFLLKKLTSLTVKQLWKRLLPK